MVAGVLHHLLALEGDERLLTVVVGGAEDALGADHEAAGVGHLAVLGDHLRHEVGAGLLLAVVPVEGHGGQLDALAHLGLALGVGELHDGLERVGDLVLAVDHRALGVLHRAKLEAAERQVHRVARHVAEGARAEVEEAAPGERMIHVLAELPGVIDVGAGGIHVEERTLLGGAQPDVPVEGLRNRVARRAAGDVLLDVEALRPHGTVRPHVHFLHVAEDAALEDLHVAAEAVAARTLVAHLGDDAVLLGRLAEVLGLPEGAHEGLLHIDVDAHLHRADGDWGVHVVGG